ncbi:hypothetical protein [uncultured Dubosiella sp.]|uniref:hypothetical protein n=1 Tax=uncultured Dubosiella sp. TaxID=1937011 RepID=UPI0026247738|nr:hypothetical protein [uncultured Dubosiella sp.]
MARPKKTAEKKETVEEPKKKYFRLVSVIKTPQTIGIRDEVEAGTITRSNYRWIRLKPGYEYDFLSDSAMKDVLSHTTKIPYRADFEEALKEDNIPYEKIYCPSCGGKVQTLAFKTCEVVEDEK